MPRSTSAIGFPAKKTVPVLPEIKTTGGQTSFIQTFQEGIAFGAGSSIARNMIDKVFLPSSRVCHEPCLLETNAFENCVLTQDNEAFCGDKMNTLRECIKRNDKK